MQGGEAGRFIGAGYFRADQVLINGDSGYPVKGNLEGHVTISCGVKNRCQIILQNFRIRLNYNYFVNLMCG